MKNLFLSVVLLLTVSFAFASENNITPIVNIENVNTIDNEHLTIKLDGSVEYMLNQIKDIQNTINYDLFAGCTVSVTVTWSNGSSVTAEFSSDDCSSALGAMQLFLEALK